MQTWPIGSRYNKIPNRASALLVGLVLAASGTGRAIADSSTPLLASYYDRHLAICGGDAYEWSGDGRPGKTLRDIIQVGVGRNDSYALSRDGLLHRWSADFREAEALLDHVASFAAGDSGALAIRSHTGHALLITDGGEVRGTDASIALTQDGSLWQWRTDRQPALVLRCPETNR